MQSATATAHRRLLIVTALLGLGWSFACRPAWSPDGKQIAYPAKIGDRMVLAQYDREHTTNEVLFVPPGSSGQCLAQWLPDGNGLVALSSSQEDNDKLTRVTVMPLDGGEQRTFEVVTEEDASNHMILPPVVVDNALFFGGKTMQRLDLATGTITKDSAEPSAHEYWLARRGDGICYVRRTAAKDESKWEIGVVDPATLRTTSLISSPSDQAWKILPMPAVTKDLERLAIPAERNVGDSTEAAILIFKSGKLESVVALGTSEQARIGSVAWGPDDVTIFATVARSNADAQHTFSLLQASFSGKVLRETPLVTNLPDKPDSAPLAFLLQAALSPDGKTAAITTAYLPHLNEADHCLMLVDLVSKERTITRVPFPAK